MAQEDIDLLYRAVASPQPIKLCYDNERLAQRERKRLYRVRERERHKARFDPYSQPLHIPLDDLCMRVHRGTIYLGHADLMHGGTLRPGQRPFVPPQRPPEEPADPDELASLPHWPAFSPVRQHHH